MKTILILSMVLLLTSCELDNKSIENDNLVIEKTEKITEKEKTTNKEVETNNLQNKEKETMGKENIQTSALEKGDLVATMKTTNGTLKIKLFNTIVPNTVNNFVGLAQSGYYDGIIFHRVINGFMIQGGDPTGTGMWGESIYGEKFNDEFSDKLKNIKYSLSMANSGKNTNGSQFFINQNVNSHLDNMHSVFGQVIEGMENVDKIAKTKVGAQDKPKKEIKIIKLTIEKFDGKKLVEFKLDKEEAIKNYNKSIAVDKNKKLEKWDTVSVHYTLIVDGEKKDSSLDRGEPFTFTLGKQMVIKGWDEGLIGHKIGDKFKLEVEPKDGYGEATIKIPKTELQSFVDAGLKLEKWEILQTGQWNLEIIDADDTTVSIANNHALAGKTLHFDIEIIDIK